MPADGPPQRASADAYTGDSLTPMRLSASRAAGSIPQAPAAARIWQTQPCRNEMPCTPPAEGRMKAAPLIGLQVPRSRRSSAIA